MNASMEGQRHKDGSVCPRPGECRRAHMLPLKTVTNATVSDPPDLTPLVDICRILHPMPAADRRRVLKSVAEFMDVDLTKPDGDATKNDKPRPSGLLDPFRNVPRPGTIA